MKAIFYLIAITLSAKANNAPLVFKPETLYGKIPEFKTYCHPVASVATKKLIDRYLIASKKIMLFQEDLNKQINRTNKYLKLINQLDRDYVYTPATLKKSESYSEKHNIATNKYNDLMQKIRVAFKLDKKAWEILLKSIATGKLSFYGLQVMATYSENLLENIAPQVLKYSAEIADIKQDQYSLLFNNKIKKTTK